MAPVAYCLHNPFVVPLQAERETQTRDRDRRGSWIDLEEQLEASQRDRSEFAGIIGAGQGLRGVLEHVRTLAPTDSTVLIEGETGTDKEVIANAIHQLSRRRGLPFVKLGVMIGAARSKRVASCR